MTGDQQPADLLDLPFDQYQRYRIAGEVLAILARHGVLPPAPTILDVGGYPGLLPRFIADPAARTVVLDMVPDTSSAHHYGYTYVIASGMELPFADGAFDMAVSLDTLEHVPAAARPALLSEIRRVSRRAALFIGPVHREETALSEELLFDYVQWLLKARQEQLAEHRGFGLPDLAATQGSFAGAGWPTFVMTAGNLYNWLFMMVAKHYLISLRDEQAGEFERRLDHFYNLTFSPGDRQDPAYRGVVVATRDPHPQALAELAATYPALPVDGTANIQRLELANLLLRLVDLKVANHEDRGLREQLGLRDQNIAAFQGRVGLLEREVHGAQVHAGNLQQAVDRQTAALEATRAAVLFEHEQTEAALLREQALAAIIAQREATLAEGERAMSVLAAERDEIRAARDQTLANRDQLYADQMRLAAELERKNGHILYLERLLQGIEAGRVFQLTRRATRLLGRK